MARMKPTELIGICAALMISRRCKVLFECNGSHPHMIHRARISPPRLLYFCVVCCYVRRPPPCAAPASTGT